MENVNYNEKVLLPFLEKKCKDLLNLNFVLEAKLLVEQNKVKDFESHIQNESDQVQRLSNDLQHANTTINQIQSERNRIESERNELLNKCIREESLKNNAISEYNSLNTKYNELLEKTKLLEEESKKKSVKKVTNTPVMI
jgi:chromosome segregation ATPase